jgi:hypothetical protein
MIKQAKNTMQGRRGPKPTTGKGQVVGVRLHLAALKAIDDWIAKQPNAQLISRPEAIRQLINLALTARR